jgi:hypothetical protein
MIAKYMVSCALPAQQSVTFYDSSSQPYEFSGSVGVAPEWENGTCGERCQEWVSSCMLSRVNQTGKHVEIWMVASNPAITWGTSPDYPRQEGAYFGNLFAPEPVAYACKGHQADVNPIPGRLCIGEQGCPYTDPYPGDGACDAEEACHKHVEDGTEDGVTECRVGDRVFRHPIMVWTH